jgi:hypothetical protein
MPEITRKEGESYLTVNLNFKNNQIAKENSKKGSLISQISQISQNLNKSKEMS